MKKHVSVFLVVCLLLALSGCATEPTPQTEEPTTTATTTTAATTATAASTTASIAETTIPTTVMPGTVITTTTATLPSYIPTTSTTETPIPTGLTYEPIYPTTGVAPQGVAQTKNMSERIPLDMVTHIIIYKIDEDNPGTDVYKHCAVLKAGSDDFNAVKDMMNNTEGNYMGTMYGKPWHIYYCYYLKFYVDLADEEALVFGESYSPRGEEYVQIGECKVAPTYGYFMSQATYISGDESIYSLDGEMNDAWHGFLRALSYPVKGGNFDYSDLDKYVSTGN